MRGIIAGTTRPARGRAGFARNSAATAIVAAPEGRRMLSRDLIDRRRRDDGRCRGEAEWTEQDQAEAEADREQSHQRAYQSLGVPAPAGGSPISDHDNARRLVEAAVAAIATTSKARAPTSTRVWFGSRKLDRPVERPTRSSRYGAQADPERNLRAYLLVELVGLSLREAGAELGITKDAARRARLSGAKLARDAGAINP